MMNFNACQHRVGQRIEASRRWLASLPDRLPSNCPLCRLPALGGHLCGGCEADFFCKRQQRSICHRCANDLDAQGVCQACVRAPEPWPLTAVVSALDYAFAGQMLIKRYKQAGHLALARPLARLMVVAAQRGAWAQAPVAWVPIPASKQRLEQTGFSPAQQLARLVALQTNAACRPSWLRQQEPATAQKRLGRAERWRAVDGRFTAQGLPAGCVVGLIDDVMTTGSTLVAAAHALRDAGAWQVVALVAARTPISP